MEEIDIEELNFDEYNRQVYIEENHLNEKLLKQLNKSKTVDIQKKYKLEIDKFISNYNKSIAQREINESNYEHNKKRKI